MPLQVSRPTQQDSRTSVGLLGAPGGQRPPSSPGTASRSAAWRVMALGMGLLGVGVCSGPARGDDVKEVPINEMLLLWALLVPCCCVTLSICPKASHRLIMPHAASKGQGIDAAIKSPFLPCTSRACSLKGGYGRRRIGKLQIGQTCQNHHRFRRETQLAGCATPQPHLWRLHPPPGACSGALK